VVAEARDAVGDPYTVLLLVDDRLHAVMDLSRADRYGYLSALTRPVDANIANPMSRVARSAMV
jgi:hypothetical protein